MQQEAVPATSRYWDNKKIVLTDNTKKTIKDKAYALDGEAMFAQYQLEGKAAAEALAQNGVSQEQLASNPNTYSFIALSSIDELETNASKEARVSAVLGLVKLGFTNIYESNTRNFITPPAEEEAEPQQEEQPQPPKQEEEGPTRYVPRRQQPTYEPPSQQEIYEPPPMAVSPRASLTGASRFIPNAVRQILPMRGPNNMTPARLSPNPGGVVRANPGLAPQPRAQPRIQQQQPRPLLNAGMAAKLGGRAINPVAPAQRTIPTNPSAQKNSARARFGLRVKR